jgi:hypothetical protein
MLICPCRMDSVELMPVPLHASYMGGKLDGYRSMISLMQKRQEASPLRVRSSFVLLEN